MKKIIARMPIWIRICCILFLGLVLVSVFADVLMPYDPDATALIDRNKPPVFMGGDFNHILGTDELGRDMLSRLLYGSRISL